MRTYVLNNFKNGITLYPKMDAYHFYDTMEYDIKCPHCGDVLRLCGNPLDLHEHGLYRCRRCDEGRR